MTTRYSSRRVLTCSSMAAGEGVRTGGRVDLWTDEAPTRGRAGASGRGAGAWRRRGRPARRAAPAGGRARRASRAAWASAILRASPTAFARSRSASSPPRWPARAGRRRPRRAHASRGWSAATGPGRCPGSRSRRRAGGPRCAGRRRAAPCPRPPTGPGSCAAPSWPPPGPSRAASASASASRASLTVRLRAELLVGRGRLGVTCGEERVLRGAEPGPRASSSARLARPAAFHCAMRSRNTVP